MIGDIQHKTLLHDFYGGLLTAKQSDCYTMHCMEDLSLSEIGRHYGITPQAVADLLKRTGALLNEYENTLHLVEKHASQLQTANIINRALDELTRSDNRERIESIKRMIDSMIL